MKTRTKVWLIIAAFLVLIGCVLFAVVMTTIEWDFMKLSTVKYETNTYEINKAFDNISINTDKADVIFAISDNKKCKIECYEEDTLKHIVSVEENTLVINWSNSRSWYDYIGVNFGSSRITVYLPKKDYGNLFIDGNTADVEIPKDFTFKDVDISLITGDVDYCPSVSGNIKIKTSKGDICVENISAVSLDLTVSTGKVTVSDVICKGDVTVSVSTGKTYLNDISCKSVMSRGNTGDISLRSVIATEKFSIERSTGDVKFNGCDADEIFVKTHTGDVSGSFLSEKVFVTQTDTKDVDVPKTMNGGKCDIITDTGDIKLHIK